jgi:hypothetical protein
VNACDHRWVVCRVTGVSDRFFIRKCAHCPKRAPATGEDRLLWHADQLDVLANTRLLGYRTTPVEARELAFQMRAAARHQEVLW